MDDLELNLVRHYVNSAIDCLDDSARSKVVKDKLTDAAFLLDSLLEERDEEMGVKRQRRKREELQGS